MELPEDGRQYQATLLSAQIQVNTIGSDGWLEFGYVGIVEEFGTKLWFIVCTDQSHTERDLMDNTRTVTVKFHQALYYSHGEPLLRGKMHHDARFVIVD